MFLGEMGVFTPSYADLARCGGGFSASSLPTAAHLSCRNKLPGLGSKRSSPDIPFAKGCIGQESDGLATGLPNGPGPRLFRFQGYCGAQGGGELDRELLVGWGGDACPQKYHRCRPVSGPGAVRVDSPSLMKPCRNIF